MAATTQTGVFLIKTPQGVTATRGGEGLSEHAVAVLQKFDGSRSQQELKFACKDAGIAVDDFDESIKELLKFEYVKQVDAKTAIAESLKRAEAERRMMQTLDFTMDDPPPLMAVVPAASAGDKPPAIKPDVSSAAPKSAPKPAPAPQAAGEPAVAVVVAAASPSNAVNAAAETTVQGQVNSADNAAQSKRDAEIYKKLVSALQPRVEAELREKLRSKIEAELRPQLMAALRPAIEAQIRESLVRELTPRVELELKTRFAKTLMAQKAAEGAGEAPVKPALPAAAVATPQQAMIAPGVTFVSVLASLDAPTFTLDQQGVCTFMSAGWMKLSGLSPEDVTGKPLVDFFATPARRSLGAFFTSVMDGSALRFERQAALDVRQGDPRAVEVHAAAINDAEGRLAGVCGQIRDATELKRLTDQGEADGVRLLLLVDQIDTGVILEDRHGNIQQVNPAFCSVLALDAAPYSLEGMAVTELFERASSRVMGGAAFVQRIAAIRGAGEDVNGESIMMADGRVVQLDYLAVSTAEEIVGRVWLVRAELQVSPG